MEDFIESVGGEGREGLGNDEFGGRGDSRGKGKVELDRKDSRNLRKRPGSGPSDEKRVNLGEKDKSEHKENHGTETHVKPKKPKKPPVNQDFKEDEPVHPDSVEVNPKNEETKKKLKNAKKLQKSGESSENSENSKKPAKKLTKKVTERDDSPINDSKTKEFNPKVLETKLSLIKKSENSDEEDEKIRASNSKLNSNNITEGEILQQLTNLSKKNTLKLAENQEIEEDSLKKIDKSLKLTQNEGKKEKNPKRQAKSSSDSEDQAIKVTEAYKAPEKVKKNKKFESKNTFGDNFPQIKQSSESKPGRKNSNSSHKSSKSHSSNSNNEKKNQGDFFFNMLKADESNKKVSEGSLPETPNLASPVRPELKQKKPKKVETTESAVWVTKNDEVEKLKKQLKEYEQLIEKQAQEIQELKKSQIPIDKKRKISPKSSGFLQKRSENTFFNKNSELLKKDDYDFWKIQDDVPNNREPQKLEDIAALKDLWILNMESGSKLNNNLNSKKTSGIKANALTKYDANKSNNIRNRFLPKIATKKDLSK